MLGVFFDRITFMILHRVHVEVFHPNLDFLRAMKMCLIWFLILVKQTPVLGGKHGKVDNL